MLQTPSTPLVSRPITEKDESPGALRRRATLLALHPACDELIVPSKPVPRRLIEMLVEVPKLDACAAGVSAAAITRTQAHVQSLCLVTTFPARIRDPRSSHRKPKSSLDVLRPRQLTLLLCAKAEADRPQRLREGMQAPNIPSSRLSHSHSRSQEAVFSRGKKSGVARVSIHEFDYQREEQAMTLSRNMWIAVGVLALVALVAVIALVASGGGGGGGGGVY